MLRSGVIAAVLAVPALALAPPAPQRSASRPFVVKDIRVEGLQRTEPGTVFSYLPVKVGETHERGEGAQPRCARCSPPASSPTCASRSRTTCWWCFVQERPAIAQIDFSGMKEFEPDSGEARRCASTASPRAASSTASVLDTRRAGDQAPVPVARPVRRRGADHGHAARAQPRRHQHRGRPRARWRKIRGINIVGAQAFPRSELLGQFVLRTPGWLTWYTKHDHYSREQLAGRPRDAALLLPEPRLPRLQHRVDAGLDHARTARTSTSPSTSPRARTTPSRTCSSRGQMLVPREELREAGPAQARRRVLAREARREHQGDHRPPRQRGLRVRQRQRRSRTLDKEKRTRRLQHRHRPGPARVRAAHRRRRQHARRATRWCAARCASSRAPTTTPRRSSSRGGASTAPSTSARSTSRRSRSRAAPTRSTCVYTRQGAAHRRAAASAWASPAWSSVALSASVRRRTPSAPASSSRPTSTAARVNTVYSLSYIDPYFTVDGVSQRLRRLQARDRRLQPVGRPVRHRRARRRRASSATRCRRRHRSTSASTSSRSKLDRVRHQPAAATSTSSTQFGNQYRYGACTAGWQRDTRDSLIADHARAR